MKEQHKLLLRETAAVKSQWTQCKDLATAAKENLLKTLRQVLLCRQWHYKSCYDNQRPSSSKSQNNSCLSLAELEAVYEAIQLPKGIPSGANGLTASSTAYSRTGWELDTSDSQAL